MKHRRYSSLEQTGVVEWLKHDFLIMVGLIVFSAILATFLMALLLFAAQPALAVTERQVRRDCTVDALKYCKAAIPPLIKGDRETIINCMLSNRDKLSPACAKHLW